MLTYTDLKNKIIAYADYYDEEFLAQIDFFIDCAEQEVIRLLRLPNNEKIVELLYDKTNSTASIPNDFIEAKTMFIKETSDVISMAGLDFVFRKQSGLDKSSEGSGYYFARIGNDFLIYPTLADNQTILFNYYACYSGRKEGAETSNVLQLAPRVLLSLALKEAMIFLENQEKAIDYERIATNDIQQIRFQIERMDNKPSQKVVPRRF